MEEREKQRAERGSRRRETKRKVQMREKRSGSERKRDNEIRLRRERGWRQEDLKREGIRVGF